MDNKPKVNIENRKAWHDYYVEESLECGIQLRGNEIKSIYNGKASIKESWITIENGEMFIKKMHISAWENANKFDVDETRVKKLLAHKSEIRAFANKSQLLGYTLVPLKVYTDKNCKCKVLVGLCKGKHNYDKRMCEKEKQVKMDIKRSIRGE